MAERYGVECVECGFIDLDSEDDTDCLGCGSSDNVYVRRITECPPGRCASDDHHYGIGFHVEEL